MHRPFPWSRIERLARAHRRSMQAGGHGRARMSAAGVELLRARGPRLEGARLAAAVVIRCARVPISMLRALAPRDVMVLERAPDAGQLRVGRGYFPVSVELGAARIAVQGPYQRGNGMNERLFDDAMIDVRCVIGRASLSAREVLQLEPGQVLALDTPVSGPFDLLCGDVYIGRAELVDVDGQVGVRIVSLADRDSPAAR